MITENLSTLKINKLTQAQYDAALAAGNISESELYLVPETFSGSSGGTVSGDVDIEGVLRVQSQQMIYYNTDALSQTFGTNNATGGTTICCGSSATVGVNGLEMRTPTILPRSTANYSLGSSSVRWAGIYSSTSVNVSSDARLKCNITDLDTDELADFVNQLPVVSYNYLEDDVEHKPRIGLIAQDVQGVDPELAEYFVDTGEDGMLTLRPADLVFPLIAAVQQLSRRVNDLEAQLEK